MGFLFFPIWVWGSVWRPFGPPELRYHLEYGRHVARLRRRRRRAYAFTSDIASHDNHEKMNSWVSFSFPHDYGAPLGGPWGRRSSAIILGYIEQKLLKLSRNTT